MAYARKLDAPLLFLLLGAFRLDLLALGAASLVASLRAALLGSLLLRLQLLHARAPLAANSLHDLLLT